MFMSVTVQIFHEVKDVSALVPRNGDVMFCYLMLL